MNCPGLDQWPVYLSRKLRDRGAVQVAASTGCQYLAVPVMLGSDELALGDYERLVRRGFLLDWAVPGDCAAYDASGGPCRHESRSESGQVPLPRRQHTAGDMPAR
ncbi:hypothetical protein PVAP13_5NG105843 [Panicum virgatum]|uniref:Uncharacterized protein n=1 Tax=Panicum virgatum TaxID=38727 RepID=A0A8T0RQS6_PANVG|nr:hypothetical protein PVAP13_5NG105843 [Panicum virgatum]